MKKIETEITIKATPEKIWEVLTDFKNYGQWNPFIEYVKGDVAKGNRIEVRLDGMTFKPMVEVFEPNKAFVWQGHLFFKGLFDGKHQFEITDNHDGTCQFRHAEDFEGILVGLMRNKLSNQVLPLFHATNQKLKETCEK